MMSFLPAAWIPVVPLAFVTLWGLLLLVADLFLPRERKGLLGPLSLLGLALSGALCLSLGRGTASGFRGMVVWDSLTLFFNLLFLLIAALTLLLSSPTVRRAAGAQGEYYVLVFFAVVGMMLLASGTDLLILFLGLETLSLSLYILAGFLREEPMGNEAALKYLLLGAFASGFFLYGIALLYGATGTTHLPRIAAAVRDGVVSSRPLLLTGLGLLLVGVGFKIAAVPFHMWAPDVYEGSPTSITALMITGTKAAVFAALLRLLPFSLAPLQEEWRAVLWLLSAVTMTVGNLVAIAQTNIKRMMAYSSIAHAGYLLIALVAGGSLGAGSVLFYLVAYALMNLGAFAVIIAAERAGGGNLSLSGYTGLATRHPLLALGMAICLFSLTGLPPTAGFMAKLYLFGAAVEAGELGLALLGVANSVMAAFYYLRVVVYMYMGSAPAGSPRIVLSREMAVAFGVAVLGTVQVGLFPGLLLTWATDAVSSLVK